VDLVRRAREHRRDRAGEAGDRVSDVEAVAQLRDARAALARHVHLALDRIAERVELLRGGRDRSLYPTSSARSALD
jgi:hypothetical protein